MIEPEDISNIHSEEVNDIMGKAPPGILFRGNVVIAGIVALVLIGAWFLRYPDIVSAPFLISSANPPLKLVAQANGKILELDARDGESVEAGKVVAVIDNPANTADMLLLKGIVEAIDTTLNIRKTLAYIRLPAKLQVGELQADYSALFEAINKYNFFVANAYYSNKLATIRHQEANNKEIDGVIHSRAAILNDQLRDEAWKDSVNKKLLKEKVISLSEYNDIRKEYLSQHLISEDNLSSVLQNNQERNELRKSLADVKQEYLNGENDVTLAVRSAAKKIRGQVSIWEKQFLLRAPMAGKVVFFSIRKPNQYVTEGTPVFMVVPVAQQYEVHVQLPLYNAGKVRVGERVLLKLREYPYEEFGMVRAQVVAVTNVAIDSAYSVELSLDNGLSTTRRRTIDYRPEIRGTADIVTNDKSILQRLFEGIYGKIHER